MGKSSHSKNVCTNSVISNSSMLCIMNIQNEAEHLGSREGLAKKESHCHWSIPQTEKGIRLSTGSKGLRESTISAWL